MTPERLFLAALAALAFAAGTAIGQHHHTPHGPNTICRVLNPPRHPWNWRASLPSGDTWASGHCP